MAQTSDLLPETVTWLLEPESPGVRYLALRDLPDLAEDDAELRAARQAAHTNGPIAKILSEMDPAGFWVVPGHGYNPKYRSTVWALLTLAQLGASAQVDERVARGCAYLLDHGEFTNSPVPGRTIKCLQGNSCWAMLELGVDDPRLYTALEWLARSITGEGVAPAGDLSVGLSYSAQDTSGPGFACRMNAHLPCAWGATKAMLALSRCPAQRRSAVMNRAIAQGVDFLLSTDPAAAAYPAGRGKAPSRNWFKFGFPQFYVADVLQVVEVLVALGYGKDPRLANALALIESMKDAAGCWSQENGYPGRTWISFGQQHKPSKWVTLRALRALQAVAQTE